MVATNQMMRVMKMNKMRTRTLMTERVIKMIEACQQTHLSQPLISEVVVRAKCLNYQVVVKMVSTSSLKATALLETMMMAISQKS